MKQLEAGYGTQLRVIYRHYPIVPPHKNAIAAAEAAEAARLQGSFWAMHDRLFENQAEWASSSRAAEIFAGYARSLKLDVDRFERDMAGPEARRRVAADQERGDSIGVTATPVVLVNGAQVSPEQVNLTGLKAAIDRQLSSCANACSVVPTADAGAN